MSLLNIICPICTEAFNNSDDVYSTSCGHLFHFSCMNEWKRRGTSCPQCRHYAPTTHKLYLSFDGSEDNSEKQAEMELKLKTSNEKITQLLVQISESETNFLQLQKQFTAVEKSKTFLEQRIRELADSERNFLQLQGQYTESSEVIKNLEERLNQILIDNECKSKELRLKRLENESLKATLEAEQKTLPEGILNEKVRILEQKLNHISEEFEKEIAASMKLSIENMKLQSHINILNSLENIPKSAPQQSNKKPILTQNREARKKPNVSPIKQQKKKADGTSNSILIKGLTLDQIEIPLVNVVINLAEKMNMSISADDLIKANFVTNDHDSSKSQLLVQFKSIKLKNDFLSKKIILKNDPATKSIAITEFMNEEVSTLFQYAKEKLRNNGFNCIFCKDNKVFAKRNRTHRNGVHIQSKAQVDIMVNINKKDVQDKMNNDDNVDENLYQL